MDFRAPTSINPFKHNTKREITDGRRFKNKLNSSVLHYKLNRKNHILIKTVQNYYLHEIDQLKTWNLKTTSGLKQKKESGLVFMLNCRLLKMVCLYNGHGYAKTLFYSKPTNKNEFYFALPFCITYFFSLLVIYF